MSTFRFACPNCGQRISGDAEYRGRQISCPACQQTITVPLPATRAAINPSATDQPGGPKKISALALISFMSSLALGIGSIPGIICGHFALARIRRDPSLEGKGLAIAGLVVSYLFLFLSLAVTGAALTVFTPPHGRQITAKEQSATTPEMLAKRRVDEVKVADPSSEYEHGIKFRSSNATIFMDKPVRGAFNGGFISYQMKVDPVQPMALRLTYWGNDTTPWRFDILVNEKVVGMQTLNFNDPGRFFDVEYAIPQKLTRGQTNVTVVLQAYPGKTVGRIYSCQMLKR